MANAAPAAKQSDFVAQLEASNLHPLWDRFRTITPVKPQAKDPPLIWRWRDIEPFTERERLLFIRGVGERTVQLLEDAGYRTVEDILREDEDKLAIKTGLGIKKARAIKQGADHFLSGDAKAIEAARREAVAKAREAAAQVS